MEQKTMPAVVYQSVGHFALEERPQPVLQEDTDAIIRVTLAAICTSDLHIKHGNVPKAVPGTIVGHEIVGVIDQLGSQVKGFSVGERVTVNVETFCGKCFFCKHGWVNNCVDPFGGWALGCRIDGGQASYVRVPYAQNGLNHIPDGLRDEQVLFTGDLLATGYWAAKISEIHPQDTVAILGAGPTGLCALQCVRLYHPEHIVVIDPQPERLQLAKRMGANHIIDPRLQNQEEYIQNLTVGRGADVVLEIAGGVDTFQTAWKIARPNAIVCIVAMYEQPQVLPLPDMYGKNLIFKTGGVDAADCEKILQHIARGDIDVTPLLTHVYPLQQAMEAYQLFESHADHVMKVALRP